MVKQRAPRGRSRTRRPHLCRSRLREAIELKSSAVMRVDGFPTPQSLFETSVLGEFGKYRIGRHIGSGCYGQVYGGRGDKGVVAVKLLCEGAVKEFETEVRMLQQLTGNRNIVTLYDKGRTGGSFYFITLELIDLSLKDVLGMHNVSFTETLSAAVGKQLLSAMRFLHTRQCTHNDVDSSNVGMSLRTRLVKLFDFGSACKQTEDDSGSLVHLAQSRNDVSRVGCIIAEMLLRRPYPPEDIETAIQISEQLPDSNPFKVSTDRFRSLEDYRVELVSITSCACKDWRKMTPERRELFREVIAANLSSPTDAGVPPSADMIAFLLRTLQYRPSKPLHSSAAELLHSPFMQSHEKNISFLCRQLQCRLRLK